jgi:hypothetical protein
MPCLHNHINTSQFNSPSKNTNQALLHSKLPVSDQILQASVLLWQPPSIVQHQQQPELWPQQWLKQGHNISHNLGQSLGHEKLPKTLPSTTKGMASWMTLALVQMKESAMTYLPMRLLDSLPHHPQESWLVQLVKDTRLVVEGW